MILTLTFISAVLSLIHYLELSGLVVLAAGLPVQFYIGLTIFLIFLKATIAFMKVIPKIQAFIRNVSLISSRINKIGSNLGGANNINIRKNPNKVKTIEGPRSYSTVAVKANKSINAQTSGLINKTTPLVRQSVFGLTSRRIKSLFASILENGAMVSLAGKWVYENELKYGLFNDIQTKTITRSSKDGVQTITLYRVASLADLMKGLSWRIILACFPNKVKISGRLRVVTLFTGYIYSMYKHHGDVLTVKYLKASQLAVQKAIGKDPINSLCDLEPQILHSRLSGFKLPAIIPSRDRKLIQGGSESVIRFWLTLFSVYRVITIPGQLKLQTIYAASTAKDLMMKGMLVRFNYHLDKSHASALFSKKRLFKEEDLLLLETASSTTKVSWHGMFTDPITLAKHGLSDVVKDILLITKQTRLLTFYEGILAYRLETYGGFESMTPNPPKPHLDEAYKGTAFENALWYPNSGPWLGKLSIKSEAAGKERVFAMVDFWTQQALKPIHEMLFKFLRNLPNDGTFNQELSVKRAGQKAILYGKSYGYDLTAATDRLPLSLQKVVLNNIIPTLGDLWAKLLTERDYYLMLPHYMCKEHGLPFTKGEREKALELGFPIPTHITLNDKVFDIIWNYKSKPYILLNYTVGQPMGALSSWAMLAVTHHFIVQLAFRQAYGMSLQIPYTQDTWYSGYELLGDDIILFDQKVAKEYLVIMDRLGVPINTSKSVCANNAVAEFAKVTTLNGKDVSAISWKQFMAGNTLMGRANNAFFLLNKGIVKKRLINNYIERFARISLHKQGLVGPTYLAIWSMLSNRNLITVEEAMSSLVDGTQSTFRLGKAILMNADIGRIRSSLPSLISGEVSHRISMSNRAKFVWSFEKDWFGIHLWKPLAVFSAKADIPSDIHKLCLDIFDRCSLTVTDEISANPEMLTYPEEFEVIGKELTQEQKSQNDLDTLFVMFRQFILMRAERLVEPITSSPGQIDSPLSVLVDQRDHLDRYNELLQLVDRYDVKISDSETAPPKVVKPTELKLIKLLRKMGDRPKFTTAFSFLRDN